MVDEVGREKLIEYLEVAAPLDLFRVSSNDRDRLFIGGHVQCALPETKSDSSVSSAFNPATPCAGHLSPGEGSCIGPTDGWSVQLVGRVLGQRGRLVHTDEKIRPHAQ